MLCLEALSTFLDSATWASRIKKKMKQLFGYLWTCTFGVLWFHYHCPSFNEFGLSKKYAALAFCFSSSSWSPFEWLFILTPLLYWLFWSFELPHLVPTTTIWVEHPVWPWQTCKVDTSVTAFWFIYWMYVWAKSDPSIPICKPKGKTAFAYMPSLPFVLLGPIITNHVQSGFT